MDNYMVFLQYGHEDVDQALTYIHIFFDNMDMQTEDFSATNTTLSANFIIRICLTLKSRKRSRDFKNIFRLNWQIESLGL